MILRITWLPLRHHPAPFLTMSLSYPTPTSSFRHSLSWRRPGWRPKCVCFMYVLVKKLAGQHTRRAHTLPKQLLEYSPSGLWHCPSGSNHQTEYPCCNAPLVICTQHFLHTASDQFLGGVLRYLGLVHILEFQQPCCRTNLQV